MLCINRLVKLLWNGTLVHLKSGYPTLLGRQGTTVWKSLQVLLLRNYNNFFCTFVKCLYFVTNKAYSKAGTLRLRS